MIEIFTLQLNKNSWNIIDKKLLNFVSEARKYKILKHSLEIDRKLSLYSSLLLRKQLSEKLKISNFSLKFSCLKNKKPIFLNNLDYSFSISHSNTFIILVISDKCIGCDVEKIRTFPINLANRIFHSSEIECLEKIVNEKEKMKYFFEIWTKKEAYSKYRGNGRYKNLKSLNTQEKNLKKNFLSWEQKEYMFSIFSFFLTDITYKNITENEVIDYFLI